jgi:hypothetical protein
MQPTSSKICVVKCSLLNGLFSQAFADSMHNGEESEDNTRFQWEDELLVRGIQNIQVSDSNTYDLTVIHPSNGEFTYAIAHMRVVNLCHEGSQHTTMAVSERLVSSFSLEETSEAYILNIELKDDEPFINPIAGVYIANRDIPSELKNA